MGIINLTYRQGNWYLTGQAEGRRLKAEGKNHANLTFSLQSSASIPVHLLGGSDMKRMKRMMTCGVSVLTILLAFAGVCHAGAWTLGQGKLYDRLALNWYYA